MRENCTSGSVVGAPGNRSPYAGGSYSFSGKDLEPGPLSQRANREIVVCPRFPVPVFRYPREPTEKSLSVPVFPVFRRNRCLSPFSAIPVSEGALRRLFFIGKFWGYLSVCPRFPSSPFSVVPVFRPCLSPFSVPVFRPQAGSPGGAGPRFSARAARGARCGTKGAAEGRRGAALGLLSGLLRTKCSPFSGCWPSASAGGGRPVPDAGRVPWCLAAGRHERNPLTTPQRGQVGGHMQASGAARGTGIAVERCGGLRFRGGFGWRGRERHADQPVARRAVPPLSPAS